MLTLYSHLFAVRDITGIEFDKLLAARLNRVSMSMLESEDMGCVLGATITDMVNTWFRQETQLVLCLAFCASWQQCQFNLEGVWICTLFLNNSQLFLTEYAPHTGHRWLSWTPDTPPMNPTTVALSCCMLPTACPCRLTTQHLHSKLTSMHSYSGLSIWLPCLFWYKKGERRSKTTLSLLCKKPWVRSLSKYFVARVLHFPSLLLSKTEGFFFSWFLS